MLFGVKGERTRRRDRSRGNLEEEPEAPWQMTARVRGEDLMVLERVSEGGIRERKRITYATVTGEQEKI